jgi:hypothetical protein
MVMIAIHWHYGWGIKCSPKAKIWLPAQGLLGSNSIMRALTSSMN